MTRIPRIRVLRVELAIPFFVGASWQAFCRGPTMTAAYFMLIQLLDRGRVR